MKKKLLSVIAAGLVVLLAACGGNGGSAAGEPAGKTGPSGTSDDAHTLTVTAWDADFYIPALLSAAEDYKNEVDPDFELVINEVASPTDVESEVEAGGSSGDYSNLADIILFRDHNFQRYFAEYPGAWTRIEKSGFVWSDFNEEKLSYSMIDGKHYGVPVDRATAVFAYRTDILREAGYTIEDVMDCTWEEWLDIGENVYNKTGKYLLSADGSGNDLPYMMLQAEGVSQFRDGKPYISDNETLIEIINVIVQAVERNALYLAKDMADYTENTIKGDMVAGVMNGNWILPVIEEVEENAGRWEIANLPTLNGGGGYAANGGASLYITANCGKKELAKDFLLATFGSSAAAYGNALAEGGVITCLSSVEKSDIYQSGIDYFNGQPIYLDIIAMSANIPFVEQGDYHYPCRSVLSEAIIDIVRNGVSTHDALRTAEERLKLEMGS